MREEQDKTTCCMRCVRCGVKPGLVEADGMMRYECPVCREGQETPYNSEARAADAWDDCMSDISEGVREFKTLYRTILNGMLAHEGHRDDILKRAGVLAERAFRDCHARAMDMIPSMDKYSTTTEDR